MNPGMQPVAHLTISDEWFYAPDGIDCFVILPFDPDDGEEADEY
jgi:hypothetical protein